MCNVRKQTHNFFKFWLLELGFIFLPVINIFGIIYVGYVGNTDKKHSNWSNQYNEVTIMLTQDALWYVNCLCVNFDLLSHSLTQKGARVTESWP